ncbi:transglutaminase domain-containing protein [archaeon]|jgi:transglutaminase-like putative cysteine protease|nr:transglutaminase domain-containing protein [archaeon]MBT6697641.1 transglutaminase domain-containing protein [archaeon]
MKKYVFTFSLLFLILIIPFALADDLDTGFREDIENLYQYESLTADVTITGTFILSKEKSTSRSSEITSKVALFPKQNFYQNILEQTTSSNPSTTKVENENNELIFTWNNPSFTTYNYQVQTSLKTTEENHRLTKDITYPITLTQTQINENNLNDYLAVTDTIDWDNTDIQAKAIELSQGKDNLFEVSFALASWVEENINYDFTTLNAQSSIKASKVLESKSGVCDEMTSLFIAMARSLGIPAKFISGLTYTNSDLFSEPWQAHGWAEVYFPGHGWVAFDPTFGEYGYVDATHIPMKQSSDPTDYSTLFRWLGTDIDFEDQGLDFDTQITNYGNTREQKYDLEANILSETVQFGSYNLISAVLEDNTGTYQAATLELFAPEEVEILTRYKQSEIIRHEGQTVIYWLIKVDENLQDGFTYTFPFVIRTESGELYESSFKATSENQFYEKNEIEEFIPSEETLLALEAIDITCDYNKQIQINEEQPITCQIKNIQTATINGLTICHEKDCETKDIEVDQTISFDSTINLENPGWKTQTITFENNDFSYTAVFPVEALDSPKLTIEIDSPNIVNFQDQFEITLTAIQESFAPAQHVSIDLEIGTGTYNWQIEEEFSGEEVIMLELDSSSLAKTNTITINYSWEDNQGNSYQEQTKIDLNVTPNTTIDKLKMLINKLSIWLTSF